MAQSAAFFDLDRTLLRGSSGEVFRTYLHGAGLLRERLLPGQGLFNKAYDVLGENRVFMAATRRLARVADGWDVVGVQEAAAKAAQPLVDLVHPRAVKLLREHHDAGRLVVLATTTPYELVKPFADLLGFDAVIATRYGVRDGKFDGTIEGAFVWGRAKADAIHAWAAQHEISLADSYAYSDSWFDTPMLSAVAHARPVNPDLRLQALATLRRWPIVHFDVPAEVPKLFGIEPQMILQQFFRPALIRYARFDIGPIDAIPAKGPAILAVNHRSYFDVIAAGAALMRRGRPVRTLAKREMLEAPVIGPLIRAFGSIRVDRGSGSDEPLLAATRALDDGELVAVFPQGTIPRGEAFFDTELRGRHGIARLAAASRAPVIPIGVWGTEHVWPRSSKLPHFWNVTSPPLVRVRVGGPVPLDHDDVDADTRRIMAAIGNLLPREAQERRTPTPEDLARTYPSGKAE